jgi:hypothetical protein
VVNRPDEPQETNFLPKDPIKIVEQGEYKAISMMAGVTRHDSMWMLNSEILRLLSTKKGGDKNIFSSQYDFEGDKLDKQREFHQIHAGTQNSGICR